MNLTAMRGGDPPRKDKNARPKQFFQIAFLLLTLGNGCTARQDENPILQAHSRVAYIEARTTTDGIGSGEFGDVVVFDLVTKKKHYVTRNTLYEISPRWSLDGEYLLFLGKDVQSRFIGIGGPHDIFVYRLENRLIEKIRIVFEDSLDNIGMGPGIQNVSFGLTHKEVLYQRFPNKLYRYSALEERSHLIIDFPAFELIQTLMYSYDRRALAFSFEIAEMPGRVHFAYCNLETGKIDSTSKNDLRAYFVEDIAENGNKVLIRTGSSLLEFYPKSSELKQVDNFEKSFHVFIEGCNYLDDNRYIFLGAMIEEKNGERVPRPNEFGIYDFRTRTIEWLTNDGFEKNDMSLFVAGN